MGADPILGAKKVLILAPHPDDETLGCGGTAALLAAADAEVHAVVVSDGSKICPQTPSGPADIVAARQRESQRAADVLGIRAVRFLGYPDGALATYRRQIEAQIESIVLGFSPDIVLTPSPLDHHDDHIAVAHAALAVARRRPVLRLALFQVYGTVRFNALVDISSVIDTKVKAIRCYERSLFGDPEPFVEAAKGIARFWSLYRRETGYYEAFYTLCGAPASAEAELMDWLTYGAATRQPVRRIGAQVLARAKRYILR